MHRQAFSGSFGIVAEARARQKGCGASSHSCASEVQPGLCCSTGRREQEATAGKITTVQKTAWARSHPGAVQLTGPQVREHRITEVLGEQLASRKGVCLKIAEDRNENIS